MHRWLALLLFCAVSQAQTIDWPKVSAELLRHYQTLVRIDTTDPPGNETKAVDYIQKVLEAEDISVIVTAKDPTRANLIARLKGNGSKRPILLLGHTDTVKVDPSKWSFPPFSATRDGGYIYGRGTLDNKWQVAAGMMTMLLLKRGNIALDRDVIFAAEAGEEASTGPGIEHLVAQNWGDIDAEACLAESGSVVRTNGKDRWRTPSGPKNRLRRYRMERAWWLTDPRAMVHGPCVAALFCIYRKPSKKFRCGTRRCGLMTPLERTSKS